MRLPDWLAGKQSMSALGHKLPRRLSAAVSAIALKAAATVTDRGGGSGPCVDGS